MKECNEIQELLLDYLYEELEASLRGRVDAHLERCDYCKAELEEFSKVRCQVRSLPLKDISEGICDNLAYRASLEVQGRSKASWIDRFLSTLRPVMLGPALAIATMLLLVLGVTFYVSQRHSPPSIDQASTRPKMEVSDREEEGLQPEGKVDPAREVKSAPSEIGLEGKPSSSENQELRSKDRVSKRNIPSPLDSRTRLKKELENGAVGRGARIEKEIDEIDSLSTSKSVGGVNLSEKKKMPPRPEEESSESRFAKPVQDEESQRSESDDGQISQGGAGSHGRPQSVIVPSKPLPQKIAPEPSSSDRMPAAAPKRKAPAPRGETDVKFDVRRSSTPKGMTKQAREGISAPLAAPAMMNEPSKEGPISDFSRGKIAREANNCFQAFYYFNRALRSNSALYSSIRSELNSCIRKLLTTDEKELKKLKQNYPTIANMIFSELGRMKEASKRKDAEAGQKK